MCSVDMCATIILIAKRRADMIVFTLVLGYNLRESSFSEIFGFLISRYIAIWTARFKLGGLELEFVGAGKEVIERYLRQPIVEMNLEDDQLRRDLTIKRFIHRSLNKGKSWRLNDHLADERFKRLDHCTPLIQNKLLVGLIHFELMRASGLQLNLTFSYYDATLKPFRYG